MRGISTATRDSLFSADDGGVSALQTDGKTGVCRAADPVATNTNYIRRFGRAWNVDFHIRIKYESV
jgi:hypothetical protein